MPSSPSSSFKRSSSSLSPTTTSRFCLDTTSRIHTHHTRTTRPPSVPLGHPSPAGLGESAMAAGSGKGFQALRLSPLPQVDGGLTLVSRSATLRAWPPPGQRLTVATLFASPARRLLPRDEAASRAKQPPAKPRCRS
ncbi:hypothetical protein G7Z17_g13559 [Cylindrodendrum hubeiense]|uniref:Uncharacterized protein n=1 Tax=Cylindrodendrum hubeiense TaxID=595255 RepID=A0A9P5GTC9_9HYPO|nr:hypothetical protein G7Z17_g13559 [Cylindrodendrum hubeiense]